MRNPKDWLILSSLLLRFSTSHKKDSGEGSRQRRPPNVSTCFHFPVDPHSDILRDPISGERFAPLVFTASLHTGAAMGGRDFQVGH